MTTIAATLHSIVQTAEQLMSELMADLMAWARAIPIDIWIMTTAALSFLVVVWTVISLGRSIKRSSRSEAKTPKTELSPNQMAQTSAAEAHAALLQTLDANEYQREQIQALQSALTDWAQTLRTDLPDATIEALLSTMNNTATQSRALLVKLHQQAKSRQISTLNQTLENADPVLDTSSKAMVETMTDWLNHHQDLYDLLNGLSTSLKTLKAHHDSPGSVRHELVLKHINELSTTLNGLGRSLETLGQDLHRVEQLMMGTR